MVAPSLIGDGEAVMEGFLESVPFKLNYDR